MIELQKLIARRTIRKYLPDPVPEDHLAILMKIAQKAPTDATGQMYSFVRVTDATLRKKVAELCGNQEHIRLAPEFFVVCADIYRLRALMEHRGAALGMKCRVALHFAIVDATIAASYLACAAELLGYGICFIGAVVNHIDELCRLLLLPKGVVPVCGLTLGRPAPDSEERNIPRLPQRLIFLENFYPRFTAADLEESFQQMSSANRRGDWLYTLERYFGVGGVMETREEVLARTLYLQGFA